MNLFKHLIIWGVLSTLLFSCRSDGDSDKSLTVENEQLRQRIQNDSLLLADMGDEMAEIDNAINQIIEFTSSSSEVTDFSTESKQKKLDQIDSLMQISNEKIASLESELKQSNSSFKNNQALLRSLEAQKKLIADQKQEIEKLTGRVIELEEVIVDKTTENNQLERTVNEQSQDLEEYESEIAKAKTRLESLLNQIEQKEQDKQRVNRQIDQEYFTIAKSLIEIAEDQKGIFKNAKNQRKNLTIKAMQYYCKAHERGVYEAMTEINRLKAHPKLGKYVKYQSCTSIMD